MSSRARRIWCGVWVVLAIALLARATGRRESKGVILDHLEFGRRLWSGEDVYGPWKSDPDAPVLPLHAPYPPSFGLMTGPFALVDAWCGVRAARFAWALLQVACLVWIARGLRELLAARPAQGPPVSPPTWHVLWLLTFVLAARFLLRDMHGGGGNLINLALCLGAFVDAERGRPRRAGLWLGLSLATKPTQVWLLPMFAVLGRWRALGWTGAVGAAAVLLTFVLQRFELAPWGRWLEGSLALAAQVDVFVPPPLDFPDFEWMNQSLRCALARWLGSVPPEFAAKVSWGVAPGLGLAPAVVARIARALSLLLLLLVLAAGCRARRAPAARLPAFALALVLSVLLSPLSWKAHHVALLPMLWLLVHRAVVARRRWCWWLLGAWVVCCQLGGDLVGDAADEWGNSIYIVTAWDLLLLGVGVGLVRSAALEHGDAALGGEPRQLVRQ